jgi:hypothetical protein
LANPCWKSLIFGQHVKDTFNRSANRSAETEKIGAETDKIQSAEKSAETGGNHL